nr:G-protein coupled receptor 84-like isoform X2 [Biomphalaria glabrata]
MTTNQTISLNYTLEEIKEYLSVLQHESTLTFIPTLIYLSLLIVVGSIGNCLVLIIYLTRMTKKSMRIFIISMALVDLFINIVLIPGEMYNMFYVWDFEYPNLCKIRRFLNSASSMFSVLILVAIAITRYRAVCSSPVKIISTTHAKITCAFFAAFSCFLSIPYGMINGRQTKETPNPKIFGHFCDIDDRYVHTKWPSFCSAIFLLFIVVSSMFTLASYASIRYKVRRHNANMKLNKQGQLFQMEQRSQEKTKVGFCQTTRVMLTITVTGFVAGYPFLGVHIYKTAHPEGYAVLEGVPLAMYHLFYRSYLLHSAVNPIIYILMDRSFRKECWTLLTNTWKCKS